jgi:acyl carrier protein
MQQQMVGLIIDTARELGDDELSLSEDLSGDTQLFGKDGVLDSMGLVSLVIAVEQAIEDHFGETVSLADEKALSQEKSPYRSVAVLAEYAVSQIQES